MADDDMWIVSRKANPGFKYIYTIKFGGDEDPLPRFCSLVRENLLPHYGNIFSINTRKMRARAGIIIQLKIFYLLMIIALIWIVRKYLCDNRKVSVRLP